MRTILLVILVVSGGTLLAQNGIDQKKMEVKTYSPEEWGKWFFEGYDLVTVESGNWNKWKMDIWGMTVFIETVKSGKWNSWTINGMEVSCNTVKKKKYNKWLFTGDGRTVVIKAVEEDLSKWEVSADKQISIHTFEAGDWDHWVIEGNLMKENSPTLAAMCIFIPIFSAAIIPNNTLK